MAVEVSMQGIILIGNADIDLASENNCIVLGFSFDTTEEATRYFNALRASINVGCIHIHVEAGEGNSIN